MDPWLVAFASYMRWFLLRQWPHAGEVCTFALVCTGCIKRRTADPDKKLSPIYDFTMCVLTTFATGVVGPLAVGEVPLLFTNDVNFTFMLILWFSFYRFSFLTKFCKLPGMFQSLTFFATLSRANNVCLFTSKAFNRFTPTATYYPIALFGPMMVSVIRGSGGNFFPFSKGLSSLEKGVPLNTQIALVCGILWHVLVNDPFVVGGFARGLLFGLEISPTDLRCAIVVFFLVVNVIWTLPGWETFNPFAPMWTVLSYVTGIEGTVLDGKGKEGGAAQKERLLYDLKSRQRIQVAYDLARAVFIVAMGCLFVSSHLPRASIFPGQSLAPGEYLGTCVFMPSLRGCEPTIAVMETSGALSVYSGQYPSDPSKKLLWTSGAQKKHTGEWSAMVKDNGVLAVETAGGKKTAWKSGLRWAARRARNALIRVTVEAGALRIYKADELAWSSEK